METRLLVTLNTDELKELINESIANAFTKAPAPKPDDEILLSRKDVAKLFSVSLVSVYKWMKSGKLPYHRISTRILFKRSEVFKAMEIAPKYKRVKKSTNE